MAERIPARLSARDGRKFGLTLGLAFVVLAGVLAWRSHSVPAAGAGALGMLLVVAALVVPARLGPVYRGWMGFAHAISKVTTPVVMGVAYFLVVAPIGVVMRLLGRNPLSRAPERATFWVERGVGGRGDMEDQF